MEFTLDFFRLFSLGLFYASPILLVFILLISGLGLLVGRLEGWSRGDAVYYAFITATTVGYGDYHPRKRQSKQLAIGIALVGLLFNGIVVAVGLHAASHAFRTTHEGLVIEHTDTG
jgi:voltage-gated potassium channel